MSQHQVTQSTDEGAAPRSARQEPTARGESAQRRERLEAGGGQPLTEPIEDGQLRGVDEEGRHLTGTHGGPTKEAKAGGQAAAPDEDEGEEDESEEPLSVQRPPADS